MYHFYIFYIYTNTFQWFVIIKEIPPRAYPHMENVVAEQAPEEHRVVNTKDQVNDHMEDDDHVETYLRMVVRIH